MTTFINATRLRLVITSPSPLFSTDLSNNTRVSRISWCRIGVISSLTFPNATFPSATRNICTRGEPYLYSVFRLADEFLEKQDFSVLGDKGSRWLRNEGWKEEKEKKKNFRSNRPVYFDLSHTRLWILYEILKCVSKRDILWKFFFL